MTEMIERVARAINPELWEAIDKRYLSPAHEAQAAARSMARARAAIAAMREPTEEMCDAGVGSGQVHYTEVQPAQPEAVWQAMIDAALLPKEPG